MSQKRQQKEAALKATAIRTDDLIPSDGTLPPVAESPKARGDSVSGSLARNTLPSRPPLVTSKSQISSSASKPGLGQPGLEVAGFAG